MQPPEPNETIENSDSLAPVETTSDKHCPYQNDGMCDEPLLCPEGTDVADCGDGPAGSNTDNDESNASADTTPEAGHDRCTFAHDGVCDEPFFCATGTDTTDCSRWE